MLRRGLTWSNCLIYTALLVCLAAGIAPAQTQDEPPDTYQLTYYSGGLSKPDATVHIVNPGTAVTSINANGKPLNGNLCADIYVFNNDEQELECCGCPLTPDSELTISVNRNLLANLVNPVNLTACVSPTGTGQCGVIKIVSAPANSSGKCRPDLTNILPTAGLRAWATHIQAQPVGFITPETEEEFEASPLSTNELSNLESQCSAIFTSGSGKGVCTCGYGD